MALNAICSEGVNRGGIPKQITLNLNEAKELLKELKYLYIQSEMGLLKDRDTIIKTVSLEPCSVLSDLNDPNHPIRLIKMLYSSVPVLSKQTLQALINFWNSEELLVTYNYNNFKIPLILENTKKPSTDAWTK